jgi:hypothetical protein
METSTDFNHFRLYRLKWLRALHNLVTGHLGQDRFRGMLDSAAIAYHENDFNSNKPDFEITPNRYARRHGHRKPIGTEVKTRLKPYHLTAGQTKGKQTDRGYQGGIVPKWEHGDYDTDLKLCAVVGCMPNLIEPEAECALAATGTQILPANRTIRLLLDVLGRLPSFARTPMLSTPLANEMPMGGSVQGDCFNLGYGYADAVGDSLPYVCWSQSNNWVRGMYHNCSPPTSRRYRSAADRQVHAARINLMICQHKLAGVRRSWRATN